MSTRGCIARKTADGFVGRYHHWDSYPEGLGATLWALYHTHFDRQLDTMLGVLIDEHPAGWSTINGADFNKKAGYSESAYGDRGERPPACYCHGDRSEKANELNEGNASACGVEWTYAFETVDGRDMMHVMSSYWHDDGKKMIGMFGCGDENAVWQAVETVDLNGEEPDWSIVRTIGYAPLGGAD